MNLLTRNWGLKLISLVLAIIIYHSLKTKDSALWRDKPNDKSHQQP